MWPEPVERVARELRAAAIDATIQEFPEADADRRGRRDRDRLPRSTQIVTSLVFVCDGTPVVALVPGDRRADEARVARRCRGRARSGSQRRPRCVEPPASSPGPSRRSLCRDRFAS